MTIRCSLVPTLLAVASIASLPAQTPAPAGPSSDPVAQNLNLRFANGIVAVAEEKIITVADVMQEIGPLLPQLRNEARNEKEFQERLEQLQDSAIQNLIDRVLIVKEFRKDEKRQIPQQYIENAMADEIAERFEGDRSKFLAYLRAKGQTIRDYRREVEENIIFQYMQGQQRKSQSIVSPVRIETYYNENKDRFYREDEVHLRLIQLTRTETETDATLMEQARMIVSRAKAGEKFEDLAKQFSKDLKRSKGGDWGPLKRSDFRKEFSEVAFNLKKGEASEPILLPEGAFILYAEDRRFAGIQPLDEVRDQIERVLIQQMSRTSQERWLERLRRNGYVKYY
ncbi:MAG: peptidyl-prolyl cis-trans isomerase [Verrucomicrobia bacterium]|jgi:peptidyl-prolyl cis-trans isomerase SurA|nr:peptidyl-prolyl cis-trans isomerase [Verrucomicrobiota bacterium]